MQSNRVKAFKNELRNYNYILFEISSLEENIEELYDRLGGVRGIDPSKEPLHTVPDKDLEYKLRDIISKLDAKLSLRRAEKERVEEIMGRVEKTLSDAIFRIYVLHARTDVVAGEMFISSNGLHHRINRALERALNEEE